MSALRSLLLLLAGPLAVSLELPLDTSFSLLGTYLVI